MSLKRIRQTMSRGRKTPETGASQHASADVLAKYGATAERLKELNASQGQDYGLRRMIEQWMRYADTHREAHGVPLGLDQVLFKHWQSIGLGLAGLMAGDRDHNLDPRFSNVIKDVINYHRG